MIEIASEGEKVLSNSIENFDLTGGSEKRTSLDMMNKYL